MCEECGALTPTLAHLDQLTQEAVAKNAHWDNMLEIAMGLQGQSKYWRWGMWVLYLVMCIMIGWNIVTARQLRDARTQVPICRPT